MKESQNNENVKEFEINEISCGEKSNLLSEERILQIDLVPGKFHFNISGIIGNVDDEIEEIESFFLAIEHKKDGLIDIKEIKKEEISSCNIYFTVSVTDLLTIRTHLFVQFKNVLFNPEQVRSVQNIEKKLRKIGYVENRFELEDIKKWHNNLETLDQKIIKKGRSNPFKRLLELLEPDTPDIYGLKTQICYTSEEEEQIVTQVPKKSLEELIAWLYIRDNTYKKFFHGYLNIKGHSLRFCTHLWKRRFIQWNGYDFFLFNVYTQEEVGSINFKKHLKSISVQAVDVTEKNFLKDNLIRIDVNGGFIELHFDNMKAYEKCLSAAEHLFGRIHKIKNW